MNKTGLTPKPLRKKNLRDPEGTKEALMQAGSELFASHGFDGVPVEAIAERAGANKAMINYHFGGKRGLYKAIVISTFEELGGIAREVAASPQPVPDQLATFIDRVLELGSTRRVAFPALFLREALSPEAPDPEVLPRIGAVVGALMSIIARGVQDGSLRPMDPFLGYFLLISPVSLFLATHPLRSRAYEAGLIPFAPPSTGDLARHLKETVLRGMRSDKERS
jgi:TetR/AcrR family transcriptional regulator